MLKVSTEVADALPLDRGASSQTSNFLESRLRAHGSHVMLDFTGFTVDAAKGSRIVLRAMREAVARSAAREVHFKSVILGEDGISPPGFTSVVLIDESHVTAHCYSDRGWLAIDIFTCGQHSQMPQEMSKYITEQLKDAAPELNLRSSVNVPRFFHDGGAEL